MNSIKWDGNKITQPGIYSGMPLDTYHGDICSGPSVSSSSLRTILIKSPAHYWHASPYRPLREGEERPERAVTEAMLLGKAAHHLLLGEKHWQTLYIVRPETLLGEPWQGNRKACKQWLAERAAKGLAVLKADQVEKIRGMARNLGKHPLVKAGILSGDIEQSYFWKHRSGLWLKARPDARPLSSNDYADLKTIADISDDGIQKAMGDHGYHIQAALVGMAHRALIDVDMESFNLVFTESSDPHCVQVKEIKQEDLKEGAEDIEIAVATFNHCMGTGDWFGPGGNQSDAQFTTLKPWAREEYKYRHSVLKNEIAKRPAPNPTEIV